MTKKTIYRTVISFVVLSPEPIPEGYSLNDIADETEDGEYVRSRIDRKQTELVGKVAVNEIVKLGFDSELFFNMDSDGNELSEDEL